MHSLTPTKEGPLTFACKSSWQDWQDWYILIETFKPWGHFSLKYAICQLSKSTSNITSSLLLVFDFRPPLQENDQRKETGNSEGTILLQMLLSPMWKWWNHGVKVYGKKKFFYSCQTCGKGLVKSLILVFEPTSVGKRWHKKGTTKYSYPIKCILYFLRWRALDLSLLLDNSLIFHLLLFGVLWWCLQSVNYSYKNVFANYL